jgi:hypothetical protein
MPESRHQQGTKAIYPTRSKLILSSRSINSDRARSNLGLEMVFFRFGDQILPSSIHRKVLRDAIPGFDTELKLLQPGENELMFGEDMQETVELLIEWCYKSTLPKVSDTTTPRDVFLRIKLWCVAARYGQVDLMNNTMDFLMRYLRDNLPRWDVEWATYAYNNTSPGSPLRNLVSKWFVNKFFSTPNKGRWTTEVFSSAAYGHPELLHDVMVHIRSLTDVQFANPKKNAPDMYHVEAAEPVEPEAPVEPVRSISAESPTEVRVATPMESTPEESDSEVYDVKEDGDPDFDEEPDENSDDDDFPLTRPGRRSTRAAKRSFPAPN